MTSENMSNNATQSTGISIEIDNNVTNDFLHEKNVDESSGISNKICGTAGNLLLKSTNMECTNEESTEGTADYVTEIDKAVGDMTDEDVLHHLDEIENLVVDADIFGHLGCDQSLNSKLYQSTSNISNISSTVSIRDDDSLADDTNIIDSKSKMDEHVHWYEEKLQEKEKLATERLSKLARVVEHTYPTYKKWLEKNEKIYKSSMCRILATRKCSLDEPYCNRYKFTCSKQNAQTLSRKECKDAASTEKNNEATWKVEPTSAWGVNAENASEFPPFVLHAVKVFEDFLQTTEDEVTEDSLIGNRNADLNENKHEESEALKQQWIWLVVRCNRKNQLMIFITGKNISRNAIDRLKYTFETGAGSVCNVKSLYCKSVNKRKNTTVSHTAFLIGSETLEEVVGGISVHLAPKTNFWSNAAGGENVVESLSHFLNITKTDPTITLLEVGCGIGINGMMLAKKCHRVIGVDAPSEIAEAEMISEQNKIKNISFLTGDPSELPRQITNAIKSSKTFVIVNTNSVTGRSIDIMVTLRRNPTVHKVVMITSLTKQSVRAILELARPKESNLGHAFLPLKAVVVDTLPKGSHFEVVILLERIATHKFDLPSTIEKFEMQIKKATERKQISMKNQLKLLSKKNIPYRKSFSVELEGSRKRQISPGLSSKSIQKQIKTFDANVEKKVDLREKLSSHRVDPEIIQKVKEHQATIEVAREKLNGPSADVTTAKEVQEMIKNVLEQANKLQSQIPRSVWDRIAPPENLKSLNLGDEGNSDSLLRGRFVQETGQRDIVITAENKNFTNDRDTRNYSGKSNVNRESRPSLSSVLEEMSSRSRESEKSQSWSKRDRSRSNTRSEKRWNIATKAQSPLRERVSSPRKYSSNRRYSPEENRRNPVSFRSQYSSSPKRHISPPNRRTNSPRRKPTPPRRRNSPFELDTRRRFSPPTRHSSSSRMGIDSPPQRINSSSQRILSPHFTSKPRHDLSPRNRRFSPERSRDNSPRRRPMSPYDSRNRNERRISPSYRRSRGNSFERRDMRRMIPHSPNRFDDNTHRRRSRSVSPYRNRNSPPRRRISPVRRLGDEWDIPSRGAIEKDSWRSNRNDRQSVTGASYDDKYRKPNMSENVQNSFSGNPWSQNSDTRWQNAPNQDGNSQRWKPPSPKKWEKERKDDWNELPEDAIDPWADDGGTSEPIINDRWNEYDSNGQQQQQQQHWQKNFKQNDNRVNNRPLHNQKNPIPGPSWMNRNQWPVGNNTNTNGPHWIP